MTDNNTTAETTTPADNIHRTPKLAATGLARCRKDNKLYSWRKGGSCKVCGARVEDAHAPAGKPKRSRKPATPPRRQRPRRNGAVKVEAGRTCRIGRVEEVSEPSPCLL